MKGFGLFDTTNSLYGSYYGKTQNPIDNNPVFHKPDMEEQFYYRTEEMKKEHFNRYFHLYKDPSKHSCYNPQDGKAFKEEDEKAAFARATEQMPLTRPRVYGREMQSQPADANQQNLSQKEKVNA